MARRAGESEGPPRGLFDGPTGASEGPRRFTVSELTLTVQGRLTELGRIGVEGELASMKRPSSGHLWFDLKDERAKLSCVVWQSQLARVMRLAPEEGMRVVAWGRLDVYGPRGVYQLVVDRLEPLGLGKLLVELEALKRELAALGWFDRARALSALPRVIGLVTSRDGAALQDFLRTRSKRWPLYPVRFAHAAVQGPLAAREVARAIARLDGSGVDVIVVARGGGSIEDLWAFNERPVAEAIWSASVPVVTGIGHETDTTLADLVADHRAHTPTDAAQTVIPERKELRDRLARWGNLLLDAMGERLDACSEKLGALQRHPALARPGRLLEVREQRLETRRLSLERAAAGCLGARRARLEGLERRLARQSPRERCERRRLRLADLGGRLGNGVARELARAAGSFEVLARTLEGVSPLAVLARGYSLTRRAADGRPLASAEEVRPGEEIETRLGRGTLLSRVTETRP